MRDELLSHVRMHSWGLESHAQHPGQICSSTCHSWNDHRASHNVTPNHDILNIIMRTSAAQRQRSFVRNAPTDTMSMSCRMTLMQIVA